MIREMEPGKLNIKIAIGITTFNDFKLVNSLLNSIQENTELPDEDWAIVINDDGSDRAFKEGLKFVVRQHQKWKNHLYLIDNKDNQGITKAWNNLSKFFNSTYTILLNNDILVTKYWLTSIIYFLENNKCGAVSLPVWYVPETIMDIIGDNMGRYEVQIIDPITKEVKRNQPVNYVEVSNDKPGRVMCPAGMLFGFKTQTLKELDWFNEETRQFYNEIWAGTAWAEKGMCSYTLPFPYCYHIWSYTFRHNRKQLKPSEIMIQDRIAYIKKWGGDITKEDVNNPHRKFMPLVRPQRLKWLSHDIKTIIDPTTNKSDKVAYYKREEYQETNKDVEDAGKV